MHDTRHEHRSTLRSDSDGTTNRGESPLNASLQTPIRPVRGDDLSGADRPHRFRRTRATSAGRIDIDRNDVCGRSGLDPRSPRFAPCRKVRVHTPALFGVTASLALGAAASASIVVLTQTGVMTVHGPSGMITTAVPATAPWFRSIGSGAGAPRLTQSLTDISLNCAIACPTVVDPRKPQARRCQSHGQPRIKPRTHRGRCPHAQHADDHRARRRVGDLASHGCRDEFRPKTPRQLTAARTTPASAPPRSPIAQALSSSRRPFTPRRPTVMMVAHQSAVQR